MAKEKRTICFDTRLNIEAYQFQGIMQRFPNHFHEHYVIGFIESGSRRFICRDKDYAIHAGDMILINPFENHICEQLDEKPLDCCFLNIPVESMEKAVEEITGTLYPPRFREQVVRQSEMVPSIREIHRMVMEKETSFQKEELFFFLIGQILADYTEIQKEAELCSFSKETKIICEYLEKNYRESISLNDLSSLTGKSKYHLLRSFTKQKGISPYSYLETIRINHARKFLEEGVSPIDVAYQTGFTDQSHFSNFFKKFIGLTPKQYQNIFFNGEKGK